MDQKTHESKAIVGSSGQVDQRNTENSRKDSNNLDNGIMLEKPVVLNPDENRGESWDLRVGDQEASDDGMGIREPMGEGTCGNSSVSVSEVVFSRITAINSGEIVSISGENEIDEVGPNSRVIEQETCNDERLNKLEQESNQNSSTSTNGAVSETVITVNSEENPSISEQNRQMEIKGVNKLKVDKSKTNVSKVEKQSCVIDVRCGSGGGGFSKNCDGERVCRICHLSSEGLAETTATNSSMELIQLGCGCKGELGIAHAYCAEAWFKLKGNRMCEICGGMAKNVTGVGDNRFIEEWNQMRFIGSNISSSDRGRGCLRGQPFCNFLMACLVVAFVLPWFFRVNMF